MLSENLRNIAGLVGEMARIDMDENNADPNMTFAWGWAVGTILKEASELSAKGQ